MSFDEQDHELDGFRVATRMRESMEHVHADPERLVAQALQVGQARRRRRRYVAGGVAALAVAGLGVGSAVTVSALADPPPTVLIAAPAAPSGSPTPTPGPTAKTPSRRLSEPVITERRLPARVAALHLSRLVPAGESSAFEGQQSRDEVYVSLALDRGEGPVGVEVNVQGNFLGAGTGREDPAELRDFYGCRDDGYLTCKVTRDEDGSPLKRTTQRVGQATVVVADWLRPDGTRVVVRTGNTADLKYGGTPRRGLGLDQAVAVATAPVWDLAAEPSTADVTAAERRIKPWTLLPN